MENIKYKRHQSEEMFQIQKNKVKELKEKCYEKLIKQAEDGKLNFNILKNPINLTDPNWFCTSFDYEIFNGEDIPVILSNNWDHMGSLKESIEIRNKIIRNNNPISFNINGIEISADVILKGDSSCYIFSRNSTSTNDIYNKVFNSSTTVIKIQKDDKCQKCFVSLCAFTENNNILIHKTFSKRQLISFSKSKSMNYYENDICQFKINIIDTGEENIDVRIMGKLK